MRKYVKTVLPLGNGLLKLFDLANVGGCLGEAKEDGFW